ncbi:hypothetical protein BJF79_21410 [Actinomadura sp. CNU-125]|uniref:hypothetical protein n=1 Tax=Actinomadura sp. CNU-125 TaxID=1904961 RepID=UPI0009698D81|nr:hypothetical protein [Actinomadura sp. CNU-125]OLT12853.1 hypothetical protein BJF79_21410 [Actinomadura sp. CNU-125]
MRSGRAGRLLRRAARNGFRGRDWEHLLAAGAAGDATVVDTLWGAWFDGDPRAELLAALMSFGRPMSGPRNRLSRTLLEDDDALSGKRRGLLIEVAIVSDHPMGALARDRIARTSEPSLLREGIAAALAAGTGRGRPLAGLLAARDDLPNAPVLLAELFLVGGRFDRYRALDPDGSLLATAYERAGPDRRERMRDAMLRAGDLDVVRVVAARDRVADLDVEQRRDLARGLLDGGRWEQAWRMAQRLPLADAARVVRELPDDRRSGGPGDAFRARLRAIPENLDELLTALDDTALLQVPMPPGPVLAGAFSPDGRAMAVVCAKRIPGAGTATDGHAVLLVSALDGSVLASWDTDVGHGVPDVRMTTRGIAVRHRDGSAISWFDLAANSGHRIPPGFRATHLARVPGALVAVEATPETGIRLRRITEDGRAAPDGRPYPAAPLLSGLSGTPPGPIDPRPPITVFEDAASGRIAFHHRDSGVRAIVDGPTGRVLADSRVRDDRLPAPDGYAAAGVVGGCFTGPDRIVTGRGLYRVTEDGGFTELAFVPPGVGETGFFFDPVFVPAWRELAGLSTAAPGSLSPGNVAYRGAETLELRRGPHPVIGVHRDALWSAPAADLFAIGSRGGLIGGVTVVRAEPGFVRELARRPLDELTPAVPARPRRAAAPARPSGRARPVRRPAARRPGGLPDRHGRRARRGRRARGRAGRHRARRAVNPPDQAGRDAQAAANISCSGAVGSNRTNGPRMSLPKRAARCGASFALSIGSSGPFAVVHSPGTNALRPARARFSSSTRPSRTSSACAFLCRAAVQPFHLRTLRSVGRASVRSCR